MESIKHLTNTQINSLISLSKFFKYKDYNDYIKKDSFQDTIFGLLFFEPSTRTCMSFESAIHRLGGKIIKYNKDFSSEKKGESLEDTIKTIDSYVDIFIIRHPEKNIISKIKQYTKKPIINAGDGSGEHPTQALLDLFTIFDEKNKLPYYISFTGDIKNSRTIHSLVYLLSKLDKNIEFHFVSDIELQPDEEFLTFLQNIDNNYFLHSSVKDVIQHTDVLYVTRMQKERFNNDSSLNHINNIIINKDTIKNSKQNLIIMHPLPRNEELSTDLDNDSKSVYFKQVENGVYVRMAIIYTIYTNLNK